MKAFLSAFLLRLLPALERRAAVTDAMASVRRAWAAVAESVAARMPERMPTFTLPKLPALNFSLPSLPAFSAPPLGKVMSSLGSMMLAPAQLHGLAAYYHLATGDIAPPAVGPAVVCAGERAAAEIPAPAVNRRPARGEWFAPAAACGVPWAATVAPREFSGLPPTPAAAPARSRAELLADGAGSLAEELRISRRSDAWQQETERGQRPPPAAA